VLAEPWFSVPGRRSRAHLLLETPDEFRNRNVFTTPEVQVAIRPGRPRVSRSVKLAKARLRQKRYRQRLAQLRQRSGYKPRASHAACAAAGKPTPTPLHRHA
jgi:hypothetical protein